MDDSPFGVAQLEQRSRQPFSALTPITHIQMEEVTRLAETCEGGKAVAAISALPVTRTGKASPYTTL